MRVIFMGTPAFAIPTLQALFASAHDVVAVYTQPPRPAGRGMKLTESPTHRLALQHAIPVHHPVSLKNTPEQQIFAEYHADIAVVAAYGLLLPTAILTAPKLGCINIHPSALPRWRGAAPIQRTLMAGDTMTACCIMQMEAGLDTGPVLARQDYPIPHGTLAGTLHDSMAELGADMTLEVLASFASTTPPIPLPQAEAGVTYAAKITKADQAIDWARPASEIIWQICGLAPSPGAITTIAGEAVKIYDATVEAGDPQQPAGTVLDDSLHINAGDGSALRPTLLQRPGKTRQDTSQFLQGFPVARGSRCH